MNEEEKKAIDRIYVVTHCINGEHTEYIDIDNIANEKENLDNCEGFCEAIDIVLNLIEKQQKELEKKNIKLASQEKEIKLLKEFHNKNVKTIDLMAKEIHISNIFDCDFKHFIDNKCKLKYPDVPNEYKCKQCIIEYFTKKAEE